MFSISEPINVWVLFKGREIQPYLFFWNSRQIKIDNINLVHTTKDGNRTLYHFSVSSGGNYYRLKFDSNNLKWFIEEVEEDS